MRILHRYKKNPCNVQYSIDTGGIEYGLLYNWYAATDARNIAPVGFHVPNKAEWETLLNYIDVPDINGYFPLAGNKLKETGTSHWDNPNTGATNEVGFNAVGAGIRSQYGDFYSINSANLIWTTQINDSGTSFYVDNYANYPVTRIYGLDGYIQSGMSLRFIADSGTPTTATGNDGRVYPCVTIGTQTWTAVNSCETRFRNGNIIQEVTDNTTWAALTTGALCAFNNDWNYVGTTPEPDTINYTLISGELPITVELIGSTTYTNNHVTLESGSFTDIPGGTYTFKVTDTLGCIKSEVIEMPYAEPVALSSSYNIDRHSLETCNVYKGFDYTLFGFEGTTMFDKVKITSIPTNGTFTKGLYTTINVNDELNYPADFSSGLYYRTSTTEQNEYSDTIGFQVRINGLWSNVATITINVNLCIFADDCVEYGYLYNWYAVTDERNIAYTGWHVPNLVEINTLILYYDADGTENNNTAGKQVKEAGSVRWEVGNTATNESGLTLVGNGRRDNTGAFAGLLNLGLYCTSTELDATHYRMTAAGYNSDLLSNGIYIKNWGGGLRLIKDSTTLSPGQTGTYTGNDGKVYPTICIGTQEWVAANLAETLYRNGDPIPTVEDNTTWAGLTTGAKCAYNNDYTNVGCGENYIGNFDITNEYCNDSQLLSLLSVSGHQFNNEGTKLFISGFNLLNNPVIEEYSMTSQYDISTLTFEYSAPIYGLSQSSSLAGFFISPEGQYAFTVENGGLGYPEYIRRYSLSTPWTISDGITETDVFEITPGNNIDRTTYGLSFNQTGSKMFLLDYITKLIYQYSLSSSWMPSTATEVSTLDVSSYGNPFGLHFKEDGSRFYFIDSINDTVYEYQMSTPFDISTASLLTSSVKTYSGTADDISISPDGKYMFILTYNNEAIIKICLPNE